MLLMACYLALFACVYAAVVYFVALFVHGLMLRLLVDVGCGCV